MDFIVELLESSWNTVIWVITDLFSMQAHFVPCQKNSFHCTLAKLFIHHVYRLRGALQHMQLWSAIHFKILARVLKLLGVSQGFSSSHHPDMNGMCEYTNGVLEQNLRCYINYQQDN